MVDTTSGPSQARIRTDLWRAVLDFSGDEKYVWDQNGLVARRTSEVTDPGPDMPTITPEQFTGWKKAFARGIDDGDRDERLNEWTERRLPASFLPPHLKHRWNGHLKVEVHKRLLDWFEAQNLAPPADLLVARDGMETAAGAGLAAAAHRLRPPDDPGRIGARADSCLGSAANQAVGAWRGSRPDRPTDTCNSASVHPVGERSGGRWALGRSGRQDCADDRDQR